MVIGIGFGRDTCVCIDTDINDRPESPKIDSCIYEQLIFHKGVKTIQWRKLWSFP